MFCLLPALACSKKPAENSLVYPIHVLPDGRNFTDTAEYLSWIMAEGNTYLDTPGMAHRFLVEGLELADPVTAPDVFVKLSFMLADVYEKHSDYREALKILEVALSAAESAGDKRNTGLLCRRLSFLHNYLVEHEEMWDYQMQTFHIFKALGDSVEIMKSYLNLGDDAKVLGNFPLALAYTDSALAIANGLKRKSSIGFLYSNYSEIYMAMNDFPKALENALKAIEVISDMPSPPTTVLTYATDNKARSLLGLKRYREAIALFQQIIPHYYELGQFNYIIQTYDNLYTCHKALGNNMAALSAYKSSFHVTDSVRKEGIKERTSIIKARHEYHQKENELILLLEANRLQQQLIQATKNNNFYLGLALTLGFISMGLGYVFSKAKNKSSVKLERKNNEIRLQHEALKHQNETLAEKNSTLLRLDKEKNYLLKVVAHDLRNPLGQISGFMQLIRLEGAGNLGPDQLDLVNRASQACDRLKNMISNILDANKLDAGEIALNTTAVNMAGIAQQAVLNYSPTAMQKDIPLEYLDLTDGTGLVLADPGHLLQSIENLLSNAIKFSYPGSPVKVWVKETENELLAGVEDNGPGISAEDEHKLFKRYQRLGTKPTAGEQSIGLGLSIVEKLVSAMNGRVWHEKPGRKGAVFVVALQKHQPEGFQR